MRMLDSEKETAIDNLILYLKKNEALELRDSLNQLLEKENYTMHIHVSETTFQREITVLLYDEKELNSLNERSKKLILEGV